MMQRHLILALVLWVWAISTSWGCNRIDEDTTIAGDSDLDARTESDTLGGADTSTDSAVENDIAVDADIVFDAVENDIAVDADIVFDTGLGFDSSSDVYADTETSHTDTHQDPDPNTDTVTDSVVETDTSTDEANHCAQICATQIDCLSPYPLAVYDVDNYDCAEGHCEYTGCNSSAECIESYGEGYSCYFEAPLVPICLTTCTSVDDCYTEDSPPQYDADNYQCDDGVCVYTGCISDWECEQSGDYSCVYYEVTDTMLCQYACENVADCDLGTEAFDSDNYDCVDGACLWTGCNTTEECTMTYSAEYECIEN